MNQRFVLSVYSKTTGKFVAIDTFTSHVHAERYMVREIQECEKWRNLGYDMPDGDDFRIEPLKK